MFAQGRLLYSFQDGFSYTSFRPPFLSVKNNKILQINEMSWSSGMFSSEHQADSAIYEHTRRSGPTFSIMGQIIDQYSSACQLTLDQSITKSSESMRCPDLLVCSPRNIKRTPPFMNIPEDQGLRFQLSHAWDQSLINIPCQLTLDQSTTPINTTSLSAVAWRGPMRLNENSKQLCPVFDL